MSPIDHVGIPVELQVQWGTDKAILVVGPSGCGKNLLKSGVPQWVYSVYTVDA